MCFARISPTRTYVRATLLYRRKRTKDEDRFLKLEREKIKYKKQTPETRREQ